MGRTPPSPPKRRLLGHLPDFLKDRLGFLMRCAAEYGDVVKLKIGKLTYLLTNPEDIRHVLITNASKYQKTPRLHDARARRLLGDGLLTSTGDAHLRRRRMLQPLFTKTGIEFVADTICEHVQEEVSTWKTGEEFDIAQRMLDLTQRVMIGVLFGNDRPVDMRSMQRAVSIRRRYYEHMLGSPFPRPDLHPVRAVRDYRAAIKEIDETIEWVIRSRRDNAARPHDMLAGFMRARDEDGGAMTDRQIRDEAISFMDTGYTTIATALTWTWYLLARNPLAESKLHAELDDVLQARPARADHVRQLHYTGMAFAESMRIYPPTWMFVRVALEQDTLPSGATLPAGAWLYLCQYIAHRNPRHFPDPERFEPERHNDKASSPRPKFSYFPFGGGAHLCVGEHLANIEGALVLASIARRFRLQLVPGQTITLDPGIALRPKDGIRMRLVER